MSRGTNRPEPRELLQGTLDMLVLPAFTVVALVTQALGIGAATAIFTVVNGVLWRPLLFTDPNRLVAIWAANPEYRLPGQPAGTIGPHPAIS
jgi:hypothetical protein